MLWDQAGTSQTSARSRGETEPAPELARVRAGEAGLMLGAGTASAPRCHPAANAPQGGRSHTSPRPLQARKSGDTRGTERQGVSRGRGRQRGSRVSNADGGVESLCKAKSWERRAGLENHGLQETETHHQVQGDGGLQQVPVQPQVPEPGHAVQVGGGEVLDGHQRGGADLRPVDFCGERRKSRVRVRGGREGC